MFKYVIMTAALLSSYSAQAMDFTELDRSMERDLETFTTRIMHSPSHDSFGRTKDNPNFMNTASDEDIKEGKGIALWEKVQAEENEKAKSKE